MKDKYFIDSNICLYLLGDDIGKKNIAIEIILGNGSISTQVISENINVLFKKFKMLSPSDVQTHIEMLCLHSNLELIDMPTIEKAIFIKGNYQLQWFDSLIIASALEANCTVLYSEDMHHNLIVENKLRILNPFLE
jgi:predicted nucleic acid-binding protein